MQSELEIALHLVTQAAAIGRQVQADMSLGHWSKEDRSPVTVADLAIQAIISAGLEDLFPDIPLMGEEGTEELAQPEFLPLLDQVVRLVEQSLEVPEGELPREAVLDSIARGSQPIHPAERYWVLDPVDGTKGFLRKEQYAIALALVENGKILLGVLGCPNLPERLDEESALPKNPVVNSVGQACYAIAGQGAFVVPLAMDATTVAHHPGAAGRPLAVAQPADRGQLTWVERVESSSNNKDRTARIAELAGIVRPPLRLDSQAKYAVVARGEAALYLRHTIDPNYRECVWDHAAGVLVVEEAGGRVTDLYGRPLDFSQGRHLTNNRGIVATNGSIHDDVLRAIGEVLGDNR